MRRYRLQDYRDGSCKCNVSLVHSEVLDDGVGPVLQTYADRSSSSPSVGLLFFPRPSRIFHNAWLPAQIIPTGIPDATTAKQNLGA